MLKQSALLSLILLTATPLTYGNASNPMLIVAEENAHHVSFYNPTSGKKSGSLEVGFLPHEIALSKDGKTAYVSNFGIRDYDSGSGVPGVSISVIDIPNQVEKYRLYTFDAQNYNDYSSVDSAPHGVKLRPPYENQLYVNVEKGHKILVFDVEEKHLVKTIPVSENTHNLFFSADGKILWLMAGKDGVIRMDADTGIVTGSFTLASAVRGLKYTPDKRYLMVSAVNQIVFIDPQTLRIEKQFSDLNVGPILYSDITPDQKYILAPAAFDHQVLVIEVDSGQVIKRLVTGLNPINVLVDAQGQFAYVSNATDKHLTKIDLKTWEMSAIPTHEGPNGLAFAPEAQKSLPKKLTLGVVLPFTGKDGTKGREMMRGYEYWKSKLMKAGGLLINHQLYAIDIIYLDSESDRHKLKTLTQELLDQYKVHVFLSTYGEAAYRIEKQLADSNKTIITPAIIGQEAPWQPNDLASGYDYFVTTNLYEKGYITQYNFKPSTYAATATATGLILQNAFETANSLDYSPVSNALTENHPSLFYPLVRN